MTTHVLTAPASLGKRWAGRILMGLGSLFMLVDGAMKVLNAAPVVEATARLGYPASTTFWIGLTSLVCTVLYLVPRTALLGAVLLTGYLGGATATHVRVEDPFLFPLVMGAWLWLGLFLVDNRVAALWAPRQARATPPR